jgi:hypothetical protein
MLHPFQQSSRYSYAIEQRGAPASIHREGNRITPTTASMPSTFGREWERTATRNPFEWYIQVTGGGETADAVRQAQGDGTGQQQPQVHRMPPPRHATVNAREGTSDKQTYVHRKINCATEIYVGRMPPTEQRTWPRHGRTRRLQRRNAKYRRTAQPSANAGTKEQAVAAKKGILPVSRERQNRGSLGRGLQGMQAGCEER